MIGLRGSRHDQGVVGDTCFLSASRAPRIPQKPVVADVCNPHIEDSTFEAQSPGRPHVHCAFLILGLCPAPWLARDFYSDCVEVKMSDPVSCLFEAL